MVWNDRYQRITVCFICGLIFAVFALLGGITGGYAGEDHGQGADMGVLQSAHETLRQIGIKPEQIKLVMNDTKLAPNSGPAGGSRSQVMSGNACRLAAENLLAAMRKEDGTYRTYDEMKAEGIETKVLGNWVCDYCATHPVDQATSQGEPFATYMYTLFLPEVCVDTQTGKVKVEKFTCVADVGTILNKLLVDGNFYGGLAQGIGLALIGAVKGYRTVIIMPDSVSVERRKLMRHYGAEVVLVHDAGNIGKAIEECVAIAEKLKKELEDRKKHPIKFLFGIKSKKTVNANKNLMTKIINSQTNEQNLKIGVGFLDDTPYEYRDLYNLVPDHQLTTNLLSFPYHHQPEQMNMVL